MASLGTYVTWYILTRNFTSSNDKPLVGDYDCSNCAQIYDAVDTVRVYTSKDFGKGFDKSEFTVYIFSKIVEISLDPVAFKSVTL